jgi:hypothetical protein
MPKRKQKQKKSNPLTMGSHPPPPPPPLVCSISTTTNGNMNNGGNSHGSSHGETSHDATNTLHRNNMDMAPNAAFPAPFGNATTTTTTTTTTFHIPSSHAEILKKYSISEKTFSKLKATFDSVIPRAVQNSLESFMDMAVHENPNAPSHTPPSSRRGGLPPSGDLVQEEFTISGNTLLPTMPHRSGHGATLTSVTGGGGGKKRPRDFTPLYGSMPCPAVLNLGDASVVRTRQGKGFTCKCEWCICV